MTFNSLHGVGTSTASRSTAITDPPGRREAVQFEATLLAVLLDQALVRDEATFGPGLGGEFARCQLCQELARTLAAGGGIGLARTVEDALVQAAGGRADDSAVRGR